jgi:hypothetical protein
MAGKKSLATKKSTKQRGAVARPPARADEVLQLADLKADPRNARKHTTRNLSTIANALREVGAARSIVITEGNTVQCGNATIQAALAVGITKVRVIDSAGDELIAVRRTGLSTRQKTRMALFDNQAAALAEWEPDIIKELEPDDLDGIFLAEELSDILGIEKVLKEKDLGNIGDMQYRVVVKCQDEEHQGKLLAQFEADGLECTAMIS